MIKILNIFCVSQVFPYQLMYLRFLVCNGDCVCDFLLKPFCCQEISACLLGTCAVMWWQGDAVVLRAGQEVCYIAF